DAAGARAGDYPEILGFHLEQAVRYRREVGSAGDHERALAERSGALLAEAGRRAAAVGDMPGAANLLERAARLFPAGDVRRGEALLMVIDPLVALGELQRSERVA